LFNNKLVSSTARSEIVKLGLITYAFRVTITHFINSRPIDVVYISKLVNLTCNNSLMKSAIPLTVCYACYVYTNAITRLPKVPIRRT